MQYSNKRLIFSYLNKYTCIEQITFGQIKVSIVRMLPSGNWSERRLPDIEAIHAVRAIDGERELYFSYGRRQTNRNAGIIGDGK